MLYRAKAVTIISIKKLANLMIQTINLLGVFTGDFSMFWADERERDVQ